MPASTITVKVSGSLLAPEPIATLAEALGDVPDDTQIVLVHGGGPQLDEALRKLDEPIRYHDGLRVTSRRQAGVVQATLDGLGSQLRTALEDHGLPAQHVDSLQASIVAKTKRVSEGPDLGRVGTPALVHGEALASPDHVTVLTPVGTDGTGPLNVNADEAAAAIATELDSSQLVFATSVPGVLDDDGNPIEHLDPAHARHLLASGTAQGGMRPKLEAAVQALSGGVEQVHVAPLEATMLQATVGDEAGPGTCITTKPEVIA